MKICKQKKASFLADLFYSKWHSDLDAEVYWYLNGDYLGTTSEFHTMSIDAAPGEYDLLCLDQNGSQVMRRFEIVGE